MTITETSGECVSLPAANVDWPVAGAVSTDSTIHLATVRIITCYQRKETEARWEDKYINMYKNSLSINITSEFLT